MQCLKHSRPRECLKFLTPQQAFNIELIRLGKYKFKNKKEITRYEKLEKIYIKFENELIYKAKKRKKD